MKAKILIIGGGVMGTSIAMRAARGRNPLTEPVVLLERRELGSGSSGRSGAVLRQHYADREMAAMARDSLRDYATFQTRTGRRIGFRRTGVLLLSSGKDGALPPDRLVANVEMQQSIGIDTRVVRGDEIRSLVSGIDVADDTVGAWEPGAGFVEPHRTIRQFAALARTYGAVTRIGVEAGEIVVENGRVKRVETTEGTYEVEHVVLAAGAWSRGLLRRLGVDLPLRILRPEQHWVALPTPEAIDELDDLAQTRLHGADLTDPLERVSEEAPPGEDPTDSHYHPVIIDLSNGVYGRCEPETRRTRLGRTSYEGDQELDDPDALAEAVEPSVGRSLRQAFARRMPVYENVADLASEAAWYTLTPDAQPIIGPLEGIEGITIVTGFSGHGFKLAPSVGQGVCQMLTGEPVSAFDEEFFSPARLEGASGDWGGAFGL